MEYELFPSAPAPAQHASATATTDAASNDGDDAFNLFGGPSTAAAATTVADPVAHAQSVSFEPTAAAAFPESPSSYELFPMASTQAPSDPMCERVEVLPTKAVPVRISRARAPPDEGGESGDKGGERDESGDKGGENGEGSDEVVENHEFVLFPAPDASFKPLPSSASAAVITNATDYTRTMSDAPLARSNSVTSDTTAAMAAAGIPLSSTYKMSGNAVDIVAVRSTENEYFTTPWHVAFGWSRFRSNITTGVGDMVRVFVNGKELPTKMQLLARGRCVFVTGGLTPPVGDLLFTDLREDQPNIVRFEHYQKSSETFRYVDARLHVWGPNESVVVADLDGTLTISDVEGHIRTLRLGQYDFLHKGACDFFMKLHELDLRIVYLTARPIDWATASRTHLENATQHAHSLPPGPLITNSHGLTGALFTEVVNKNPHIFKAQVLNEIQLTLIHAGRVTEHPVFVAGFGNRPTDTIAYESVGMDPALIFLLDPYSNLRASSDPRIYESYSDPNALLWLLPRLKHRVPIEKVARIDDYTVRELVLAEDREQLLMAERQARALQEEEFERARASSAMNSNGGGGSAFTRALYGS